MPQQPNFTWYLPSLFGDIRLDAKAEDKTLVTMEGLSPQERIALQILFKRATKVPVLSLPWTSQAEVDKIDLARFSEQSILLSAPITDVQKVLEKPLKPMRKQVSAVRFKDGKIEQITESNIGFIESAAKGETVEEKEKPAKKPAPAAAVTVAQPVIGCPAPDFDPADIRATRVLSTFLTPEQLEDFRDEQRFVVTGADTGHRYLLTSRHAPQPYRHESFRSVFDIDDDCALCVHDWEVPAAEELLGLMLHLTLPGLEGYVRSIPAE